MNGESLAWLLAMPVLLPFMGAALSLLFARRPRIPAIISVATLSIVLAVAVTVLILTTTAPVVLDVGGWSAPVGITLIADRLSALMLTVSVLVTLCVLVYSLAQNLRESNESPVSIFHPTFLILSAGVSNVFLTGDLFNMYVGFEILLVSSFVLITLGSTRDRIRAGTIYVIVSLVSSVIFLVGIAITYAAAGTVNLAQLAIRLPQLDKGVVLIIEAMLLVGFAIKAAIFPLSAWLPDSYPTAPAPVTAVFAGLLTKVGVYAIVRTQTLLFPESGVERVLLIAGFATMIIGILGAMAQDDLKRMLSFTLVSHIGFMMWGVGLRTELGLTAAIFYTAHHIIVQTALFLVSGLMEHIGGTTSLSRLGSLLKAAPLVAVLYLIPAFNLSGIPPFSGFLGKIGLLQASVESSTPFAWALFGGGLLASLLTLYVMMKAWHQAFWQDALVELPMRKAPRLMLGATMALIAVSLLITLFARPIYGFANDAATTLRSRTPYIHAVLPDGDRGTGESDKVAEKGEREEQAPIETPDPSRSPVRPSPTATPAASATPTTTAAPSPTQAGER